MGKTQNRTVATGIVEKWLPNQVCLVDISRLRIQRTLLNLEDLGAVTRERVPMWQKLTNNGADQAVSGFVDVSDGFKG